MSHTYLPAWHPRRASAQPRPWPVEPLLEAAALGPDQLLARLRLSGRQRQNAFTWGLTDREADRWACKLSLHPGQVWPRWFDIYTDRALLHVSVLEGRRRRQDRIDARLRVIHARPRLEMAA